MTSSADILYEDNTGRFDDLYDPPRPLYSSVTVEFEIVNKLLIHILTFKKNQIDVFETIFNLLRSSNEEIKDFTYIPGNSVAFLLEGPKFSGEVQADFEFEIQKKRGFFGILFIQNSLPHFQDFEFIKSVVQVGLQVLKEAETIVEDTNLATSIGIQRELERNTRTAYAPHIQDHIRAFLGLPEMDEEDLKRVRELPVEERGTKRARK